MINIVIADDHLLFADGVEQIVNNMPNYRVVGKASNGKELLNILKETSADLILLDINMPFVNGLEAFQRIKILYPQTKIIFLSMYMDSKIVHNAKEAGLNGFIQKAVTAPQLKERIIEVMNGGTCFEEVKVIPDKRLVDGRLVDQVKLSGREIEIIKLLKEGLLNKEISGVLGLSIYTIETHRKNIYKKLKLKGLGELIQYANDNLI